MVASGSLKQGFVKCGFKKKCAGVSKTTSNAVPTVTATIHVLIIRPHFQQN